MEERPIYGHQRMGERVRKEESRMEETVQNPFAFVFADSLLNVMVKVRGREHWLAREELLRRIQESDVKACLNVLQEIVRIPRQSRLWNELEEKALEVMTRSYSYFNETLWEDFAIKDLSFEAFKKLCSAAKRAKPSWDKSSYGGVTDSDDSNSEDEYGQLNCPSMKEDFKAILHWIQREDIEEGRRDLVLAVFKTSGRKSKASVLLWMKAKIENWERKEREEEEEMKRIGEEVERDRALGIPFTSGIPGPYGARLDARFKMIQDLSKEGHSGEEFYKKLKSLTEEFEEEDEDEDGLYYEQLNEQFVRQFIATRLQQSL